MLTALTKNKILKNFSTLIREFFETFMFVDIMIPIIEESNKTAKVLNKLSLELDQTINNIFTIDKL